MEKGVCNLIQKYTPEAVRERALSSPTAAFQIVVSSPYAAVCVPMQRTHVASMCAYAVQATYPSRGDMPLRLIILWLADSGCNYDYSHGPILSGPGLGSCQPTGRHTRACPVQGSTAQVCGCVLFETVTRIALLLISALTLDPSHHATAWP